MARIEWIRRDVGLGTEQRYMRREMERKSRAVEMAQGHRLQRLALSCSRTNTHP